LSARTSRPIRPSRRITSTWSASSPRILVLVRLAERRAHPSVEVADSRLQRGQGVDRLCGIAVARLAAAPAGAWPHRGLRGIRFGVCPHPLPLLEGRRVGQAGWCACLVRCHARILPGREARGISCNVSQGHRPQRRPARNAFPRRALPAPPVRPAPGCRCG
jgi:hypothetical protein